MRQKLAVVLVMVVAVLTAQAGIFPETGKAAPAFRLKDANARNVSLADFRGKWVVLYFYPKDFTSGCTVEAHNFQRDLAKYKRRNARVVGVSVDSTDSHKKFCTTEKLEYTILSDSDAAVSKAYNSVIEHEGKVLSARNTFLIDPRGKLVRIFSPVKPAAHSDEVLAALDELRRKK
jgi:peroxiredoxin Q/BCP